MQIIKKSLKIVGVLAVLVVFWLFYFVIQATFGAPKNENHYYIPESAQLVVAFNGDLTIKSVLSDFFSAQDEMLLDKINNEKSDLKEATGINYLSDVLLFSFDKNSTKINGLLFNLTSEKDFKSNFEGSIIASNKTVGVLLFDSNISKDKLNAIAENLIAKKTGVYANHLSDKRIESSYISIWTRKSVDKLNWKYTQLSIDKHKISINGEVYIENFVPTKVNQLDNNSSSINFSTTQFPRQFSDTILSLIDIDSNFIIGISANYRSLRIEQENTLDIVPDADFIYQFKNDINISDVLEHLESKKSISEITPIDFIFGGKSFHYKQIDSKTIYIGRTDFKDISFKNNSTSALSISGAPFYLTKIEGNSFILRLISIFPAYRVGSSLSNAIKNIDLKVEPISTDTFKVNGEIEFSKEKYASIELIRNLLELRQ